MSTFIFNFHKCLITNDLMGHPAQVLGRESLMMISLFILFLLTMTGNLVFYPYGSLYSVDYAMQHASG